VQNDTPKTELIEEGSTGKTNFKNEVKNLSPKIGEGATRKQLFGASMMKALVGGVHSTSNKKSDSPTTPLENEHKGINFVISPIIGVEKTSPEKKIPSDLNPS
jgi:hypothetical protein